MTEEQNQTSRPSEAEATTGKGEGKPREAPAPEGAAPASDLFDLMGAGGEQFKKKDSKQDKKPEAKATNQKQATAQKSQQKHPAGMEIHHAGHKLALPEEMTEAEVFAFLSDDFPEVTADRAEIREDKQKGRLVVAFKSFKKGRR